MDVQWDVAADHEISVVFCQRKFYVFECQMNLKSSCLTQSMISTLALDTSLLVHSMAMIWSRMYTALALKEYGVCCRRQFENDSFVAAISILR